MPLDPFITTAELTTFIGSDASGARGDFAVEAACDYCRTFAEQVFNDVVDDTITLDGTGTDSLVLPYLPVTEVSEVIEDDETLVLDTDYALNDQGVLIRLPTVVEAGWSTQTIKRKWSVGRQNIEVTYSHGYADGAIPQDLRAVALSIASRLFQQTSGVTFEALGQYSVRYDGTAGDLTTTERAVLRKYRDGQLPSSNIVAS